VERRRPRHSRPHRCQIRICQAEIARRFRLNGNFHEGTALYPVLPDVANAAYAWCSPPG
jgi:hypothetical protein